MAAGLAQPQPSSDAWPAMGFQAESGLNLGWILDQKVDGAGGFLTNSSPTSSGLTFVSTGDATLFYQKGRAIRVIQAAGTAICTVGQSSFSGGITTVYLNQFSTQVNLSTALSTGAITSAAAGPIVVGTTTHNIFSGGMTVVPTTGGGSAFTLIAGTLSVEGSFAKFGTNPAAAGQIRLGNDAFSRITGRNFLNSGDVSMIAATTADIVAVGAANGNDLAVRSGAISVGTTPASSGVIRVPNSAIAIVGKTSTGGDDIIYPAQFSSTTLASDIASSGANFTNIFSKLLPVGTWKIDCVATFFSTVATNYFALRLHNGTDTIAISAWPSVAASTQVGYSLPLAAIVAHTTALTYTVDIATSSTGPKAVTYHPSSTSSTGATWFTAVKTG